METKTMKVWNYLADRPGITFRAKDIAQVLSLQEGNVFNILAKLVKDKNIVRVRRGRYSYVDGCKERQ